MNTPDFVHELAVAQAVGAALSSGLLSESTPCVLFHELTQIDVHCAQLRAAFPGNTFHTFAIKANPLRKILERVIAAGLGLEAASFEEVELALAAGCSSARILFDSPAKTRNELKRALHLGVFINIDSWSELERLATLNPETSTSRIGLRINPLVGAGNISSTSVATATSKFGVPWTDEARIIEAFAHYPWLTGLHAHIGSQGGALEPFARSSARLAELAARIEARLGAGRVQLLDIGGGLSVQYRDGEGAPTFQALAAQLIEGRWQLATEFGRALLASTGFTVSRIEYIKGKLAVVHAGADLFLRRVYAPRDWHHRVVALTPDGQIKSTQTQSTWKLAGPLCFAGDILGEYELPSLEEGDLILIRDTGAYTMSLWSRHCNRAMPAVVGYERSRPTTLSTLRPRETTADVVRFWSGL